MKSGIFCFGKIKRLKVQTRLKFIFTKKFPKILIFKEVYDSVLDYNHSRLALQPVGRRLDTPGLSLK